MDVAGVLICAFGLLVGAVHMTQDLAEWREVRALRRSGRRVVVEVVDNESYRRFDVRRSLRRPVVSYRFDGRSYRSTLGNYLGAAPLSTGVTALVLPAVPLDVVAADRNDARNQLIGSLAVTVLAVAAGGWAILG